MRRTANNDIFYYLFTMFALFSFPLTLIELGPLDLGAGAREGGDTVLTLSSYVAILAQSVCKLAQVTLRN